MAEYIERKPVCGDCIHANICHQVHNGWFSRKHLACKEFKNAADVVEVVRGEWLERQIPLNWCEDDVDTIYICSECEGNNFCETPYCPNCGAKMGGERRENDA